MDGNIYVIDAANAPALGDLREAGPADLIYVRRSATTRKDWARYWDALRQAWARGAFVSLMNNEEA